MTGNPALFLFLAAAVIAVFAFASIFVWVNGPARERQARDRLALLKTLAESPSPQAREVLDYLREEDRSRARKKEREERRGWIVGGFVLIAIGIALAVMGIALGDPKAGSVGLIPFLIGCVLLGVAGFAARGGRETR
jgi:Flp pilus assembly protein TadB